MRTLGAVCFSLLISAVPATASDQNLKDEVGKIGSAYEISHDSISIILNFMKIFSKPGLITSK